jgi:hypothetical protein
MAEVTAINPNVYVTRCVRCGSFHDRRIACRLPADGVSAPSAMYSCGRCASGPHSADMSLAEAMKHAALVHNTVVRRPIYPLAVRVS